jgi:N-formylglutamate deformylase
VRRNDPYKGVEIVRKLGQPHMGKHSTQIEINRALYMNESTREIHAGFHSVKETIRCLMADVAVYASAQTTVDSSLY